MEFTSIIVVVILLIGAAFLGFIVSWMIRQARIEEMIKLVNKFEKQAVDADSLVQQYHTDRDLLKEEVQKYKEAYNEQVTKSQRLHENIRQNQDLIENSRLKVKELTEISLQAQTEIDRLKMELLSRPKSIKRIIKVKSKLDSVKMGGLSLLDNTNTLL